MKAILTYHSIDDSGSVISVARDTFRDHVGWLVRCGVAVVPLATLLELPRDANAIAITFDDGFENFATNAWPLLRDNELPVTLFVVTERAGGENDWGGGHGPAVPRMSLLGWDELGRLAESGMTLGSHTRTHADLRRIGRAQQRDEIEGAVTSIQDRTGQRPAALAYPFGSFDSAAVSCARSVHSLACTTELRAVSASDDPLQLPRLDAYYFRAKGMLERYGSAGFRRYVWLRANGRRLRQALTAGATA